MRKKDIPLIKALTFIVFLVLFLIIFYSFNLSFTDIKEKLVPKNKINPTTFVLYYILLSVLFFPISYLSVFSGYSFGIFEGAFLSIVSLFFSSLILFYLSRYLLRPFFVNLGESKSLFYLTDIKGKEAIIYCLIMRILPIPFALVCVISGLTKIRVSEYVVASIVWLIPETFFLSFLGDSFINFKALKLVLIILVFIMIYLIRSNLKKSKLTSKNSSLGSTFLRYQR